jgi:hypothetical protein
MVGDQGRGQLSHASAPRMRDCVHARICAATNPADFCNRVWTQFVWNYWLGLSLSEDANCSQTSPCLTRQHFRRPFRARRSSTPALVKHRLRISCRRAWHALHPAVSRLLGAHDTGTHCIKRLVLRRRKRSEGWEERELSQGRLAAMRCRQQRDSCALLTWAFSPVLFSSARFKFCLSILLHFSSLLLLRILFLSIMWLESRDFRFLFRSISPGGLPWSRPGRTVEAHSQSVSGRLKLTEAYGRRHLFFGM